MLLIGVRGVRGLGGVRRMRWEALGSGRPKRCEGRMRVEGVRVVRPERREEQDGWEVS